MSTEVDIYSPAFIPSNDPEVRRRDVTEMELLKRILALLAGAAATGAGGAGGAVTIANGANVTQGAVADAAVGDATGTLNAHLRYIAKCLGEVQVSPTANTLLDRIKSILTGVVLAGGSNTIGGARDAGPSWTTVSGIADARFTSADQSGAVASCSDSPTAGQKLVVTDIEISADAAMRVDFTEEDSALVIATVYMAANTTVNLCTRSKRKLASADKRLQVRTSAAGNISVNAFYYSEA